MSTTDWTDALTRILDQHKIAPLEPEQTRKFTLYLDLLLRWNARQNLTAVREPEAILSRHFLESIACARALPVGVHTVLDLGSGAGFPGLPIALCRQDFSVTLAESQGKKAAFLREVVRSLEISVQVHGERAETLTQTFDCVVLRAVDKMHAAVRVAAEKVRPEGWLAPLSTPREIPFIEETVGEQFQWEPPVSLPGGEERLLLLGARRATNSL